MESLNPEKKTAAETITYKAKLSPAIHKAVVNLVKQGNWIQTASRAVGIPRSTMFRWMQIGRGEHPTRAATEPYLSFAKDVDDAFATAEVEIVQDLRSSDDWRAKAWLLESGPARDRWSQSVNINAQMAPAASILDTLRQRSLTQGDEELEPLEIDVKELKEPENAKG